MTRPTRRAGRILAGIAVAGLAAALGLVVASPAYAGTYVATDAASLITAIGLANADPGSTIQISPPLPGNTITMSGTNPQLTQATTVVGDPLNPPTIIGPITPAPIFQFVNTTGNLEIDNVKMVGVVTGGDAVTTAGGSGSITLKNDSFTSFPHPAVELLLQTGPITVTDCTFTGNVAGVADHDGAAISAGAVNNVTITGSTFRSNTAANHGGALFLGAANSVNISGSTFDQNSGGIDSGAIGLTSLAADSTWTGNTFTGNTSGATASIGGAAFDVGAVNSGATFLIDRSTFSGNSAAAKAAATSGAVGYVGSLTGAFELTNSTMTGNSFTGVGPAANGNGIDLAVLGVGATSEFNIVQSTLIESASGNDLVYVNTNAGFTRLASSTLIGPGVLIVSNNTNAAGNAVETRDTIAISTTPLVAFDISGTPAEISYSITSDVAKPQLVDVGSTQFSLTDAHLGALANNGGPTQTRLPLAGSPAIDTGDPTFTTPVTDQRGLARIVNGRVDIGAVEAPAATATTPTLSATGVDPAPTAWAATTTLAAGGLLLGAFLLSGGDATRRNRPRAAGSLAGMPERSADREYGFRTRAIHAGNIPDAVTGSRALPIYQTSAFVFDDTADAAARFALQKYGNIYSRLANPTVASFEERVASLEGGIGAVATASGLGAEFITFASLAGAGDHIVASSSLYGGTITQLDVTLRRFGVETTFVNSSDPADYDAAITDKTKLIFVETIANPSGEIADLEGLAAVAHSHHIPLIVDSTVATPYLNRPIEWGADVVIHSATKFLGGHGTTLGGVVVESGRFHWANENFPLFDQPVAHYGGLNWHGNFGEYAFLTRLRAEQLRDIGPTLAPHSAWLLAQGVETLPFRMQAHVENAQAVAEWLEADKRVEFVNYAGLPSHAHHERAAKYLPKGPGSVFSFGVKGSASASSRVVGQRFIESVNLASHLANIGDAKTLVIHPASTTHAQLSEEQLLAGGVLPGLVRISVGIEDLDDIIDDLDQALDAAVKGE